MIRSLSFARRAFAVIVATAALLVTAGCGNGKPDLKLLDETLKSYISIVRWADIADTLAFVEPSELEKVKPTTFELERWKQVRIGGLREQPPTPLGEGRFQQVIQLDLINVNTQAVRNVSVVNTWRYDVEAEKWWLTNGLPKLDR